MPPPDQIIAHLHNPQTPVAARMRAIFGLKGLNTRAATSALEKALLTDASALVRHEAAYALGQMGARAALPTLSAALRDEGEEVMVRHEAAEAMGAIGDASALEVLAGFAGEGVAREIRETCALAIERIGWAGEEGEGGFCSVDPAPAAGAGVSVGELRKVLCDGGRGLFERYRAMFGLRNRGGREAVEALCEGMQTETGSALFRHEVAYVLGQMRAEGAVPALVRVLRDVREHGMVRHEAAEALGAVGGEAAERELGRFRGDEEVVVRESVEVALDVAEFEKGGGLHYAETVGVGEE